MFPKVKNDILGKDYSLSIALVDQDTSQALNKRFRQKDKPTNVLSFALTESSGELVLCPTLIKEQSKNKETNFGKNYSELMLFLVIHGMLHLKGMQHSSRMEREEEFYCSKYKKKAKPKSKNNVKKHISRNRRGLRDHKSGSGRIYQGRKKS